MIGTEYQLFFQLLISGIATGSIYALIALGFVLIYKATDVLNFAQGELMMLGAYFCFAFITQARLPFLPAFIFTLIAMAILAFVIEISVLRPLLGKPIFSVVMITIGLSILLRGVVGLFWGHEEFPFPSPFSKVPINIGGIAISHAHFWTIVIAVIFLVIFFLFFRFSRTGLGMRATAGDQDVASLMGINIKRIFTISWSIAAVVSSVAGVALASVSFMHPLMSYIGLRAFPAAVLGGLDSIPGAILGGIIIGVAENLAGGYVDHIFGGGVKEITAFIVVLIVMMVRPYGFFGTKEIERV